MEDRKWVAVWGNSISCDDFRPSNYAKDITLRYIITTSLSGKKIRLRFANTYGYEDVTLSGVTLGKTDEDGIVYDFKNVTFDGKQSAVICKGGYLYSDEIDFFVNSRDNIAISIYLDGFTDMHTSITTVGPLTRNSYAKGNFILCSKFDPFVSENTGRTFFLDTVEVLTEESNKAAIIFGDSISAQSWPEWLSISLMDENRSDISVIRRAVSGSRVLREYSNLSLVKYAHAGIVRFESDISSVSGADRIFVLHGINDIIHPHQGDIFRPITDLPTANDIIEGYKKYINIAHKYGLKIYFATIMPFSGWRTYDEMRNLIRVDVNKWIMSNTEADGYIDFAKAVSDPENPVALLDKFDSNDHLHPSLAGGKKLAETVPAEFLV